MYVSWFGNELTDPILDFDARRLIKRQKLTHPRFGVIRGARTAGSQHGFASQHANKVGRQQLDESRPLEGNANDNHKPSATITTAISGGEGRVNVGSSKAGPIVRMDWEVNPTEVRAETLSFFVLD